MSKITVRCALTAEQYEAFQLLPGKTEEQKIMQAIATQWMAIEARAQETNQGVAQLVEQASPKRPVGGSSPSTLADCGVAQLAEPLPVKQDVDGSNPSLTANTQETS